MITLDNVTKIYPTRTGPITVLDGVNLQVFPGEKVGILGRNGAGKSTLVRLISGAEAPDKGSITRNMSVSWPLAFGGAFQSSLTGLDNLNFICRIYGIAPETKRDFVEDFSELGRFMKEPVRHYSSGMRARLAFAISMAIEFDCFLIDEVIAVGDERFAERCHHELFEKRSDRAMIIVSHNIEFINEWCTSFLKLHNGSLTTEDSQEEIFEYEASAVA